MTVEIELKEITIADLVKAIMMTVKAVYKVTIVG